MFSRIVDNDYEIFTIKPDGTGVKRLTNSPGNDAHQGWSPDGEPFRFDEVRLRTPRGPETLEVVAVSYPT